MTDIEFVEKFVAEATERGYLVVLACWGGDTTVTQIAGNALDGAAEAFENAAAVVRGRESNK